MDEVYIDGNSASNVAMIIRLFLSLSNISLKAPSTIDSLLDIPVFRAFVESLISKSTPSSPILAILCKSAIGPIGVKSNLKSPVVTIVPFGVLTLIPWESGTEWVVLKKSTSKYLNFIISSDL